MAWARARCAVRCVPRPARMTKWRKTVLNTDFRRHLRQNKSKRNRRKLIEHPRKAKKGQEENQAILSCFPKFLLIVATLWYAFWCSSNNLPSLGPPSRPLDDTSSFGLSFTIALAQDLDQSLDSTLLTWVGGWNKTYPHVYISLSIYLLSEGE